ncbi:MAG: hypothetical protein H0V56_06865 [Chthoniobacterales bacterium]|nr:hypothetical protein [Chthoniobacterales bacterium]
MKLITCALLLTLCGGWQLAAGADATSTMAAPETVATDKTTAAPPALELKHKSSFALEENSRNPFWPIGWKPAPKANGQALDAAGPEVPPDAFLVSSITMDVGARFAIINGKVMSEGQVFGLQLGNQTYQITVKSIEDGRVILLRRDQEIEVPLRRR